MNQQDHTAGSRLSSTENRTADLLSRLVGCHLQSIHFNGGFVQFAFACPGSAEVPVLTCEVTPTVETPSGSLADGDPGYADAIRALIGHHVIETREIPRNGIRIVTDGAVLILRPEPDELRGPQIAVLSDFTDGDSKAWYPGSEPFEYLG